MSDRLQPILASFLSPSAILRMMVELQVELDRPQETHMWETFGECIYQINGGGRPDYEWARQASICNKLCIAVEQSAQENCRPVDVKDWF